MTWRANKVCRAIVVLDCGMSVLLLSMHFLLLLLLFVMFCCVVQQPSYWNAFSIELGCSIIAVITLQSIYPLDIHIYCDFVSMEMRLAIWLGFICICIRAISFANLHSCNREKRAHRSRCPYHLTMHSFRRMRKIEAKPATTMKQFPQNISKHIQTYKQTIQMLLALTRSTNVLHYWLTQSFRLSSFIWFGSINRRANNLCSCSY